MKWSGAIGYRHYEVDEETSVSKEVFVERRVKGDAIKYYRQSEQNTSINTNTTMALTLSAILDDSSFEDMQNIVYVVFKGQRWKVTSIDPSHRPRIEMQIGGTWNAKQT